MRRKQTSILLNEKNWKKYVKFNCDPVTYESFIKNIFCQVLLSTNQIFVFTSLLAL